MKNILIALVASFAIASTGFAGVGRLTSSKDDVVWQQKNMKNNKGKLLEKKSAQTSGSCGAQHPCN